MLLSLPLLLIAVVAVVVDVVDVVDIVVVGGVGGGDWLVSLRSVSSSFLQFLLLADIEQCKEQQKWPMEKNSRGENIETQCSKQQASTATATATTATATTAKNNSNGYNNLLKLTLGCLPET